MRSRWPTINQDKCIMDLIRVGIEPKQIPGMVEGVTSVWVVYRAIKRWPFHADRLRQIAPNANSDMKE